MHGNLGLTRTEKISLAKRHMALKNNFCGECFQGITLACLRLSVFHSFFPRLLFPPLSFCPSVSVTFHLSDPSERKTKEQACYFCSTRRGTSVVSPRTEQAGNCLVCVFSAQLEKKVREMHALLTKLEEEKYDWEVKIRRQDYEVRAANSWWRSNAPSILPPQKSEKDNRKNSQGHKCNHRAFFKQWRFSFK